MKLQNNNLFRDLAIVVISVLVAIVLVQSDTIEKIVTLSEEFKFLSAFLAGIFFISIFTVAPAVVILIKLMQANSLVAISFFAALGAVVGDLVIFRFIKNNLTDDLIKFFKVRRKKWWQVFFQLHRFKFKWLLPVLGAIVIASPFPDEIGLAMMGFSKIKTSHFIILSFILNFIGILIIGLITT